MDKGILMRRQSVQITVTVWLWHSVKIWLLTRRMAFSSTINAVQLKGNAQVSWSTTPVDAKFGFKWSSNRSFQKSRSNEAHFFVDHHSISKALNTSDVQNGIVMKAIKECILKISAIYLVIIPLSTLAKNCHLKKHKKGIVCW